MRNQYFPKLLKLRKMDEKIITLSKFPESLGLKGYYKFEFSEYC